MGVRYLSREEWEAGPIGAGHAVPHSQFTGLAVHHTVMVMPDYDRDGFLNGDLDDICRYMRQLQVSRPDLGLEVPYSFVVFLGADDDDCVVAEGRGFGRTGAHTAGQNSSRYGVAFAGNASVTQVTDGVIEGIRWVGSALEDPGGARPTVGHRDLKPTECPGNTLYARLGELQPPFTRTAPQEDEMSAEEVAAINKRIDVLSTRLRETDGHVKNVAVAVAAGFEHLERHVNALLAPYGSETTDQAGNVYPRGDDRGKPTSPVYRMLTDLTAGRAPEPPEAPGEPS